MDNKTFGFDLIKVMNTEKQFGSNIYVFEHKRTGLKVFYCFPTNYVMRMKVSFYTPQLTDKGITHILEHLLCHTRSRYKEKWYMPSFSNGKTDFNAATTDDYTFYELSSASITEFRTAAKSLLSSVFREKFDFTDEEIGYEAGYIKDYDTVDGVIYNELKRGMEDPESMADEYVNMLVFADSHYQHPPGGLVEGVVRANREELENYFNYYYHPSNCKIFVCGGFDIFKFLEYLDKNICKTSEDGENQIEKREIEKMPLESSTILTDARVPFYAPNGYPKGENIYVWGIKLPHIEDLAERALYEVCMKAIFDGSSGPFDYILRNDLAKRYKKTILLDRVNAPYLRITFYNVPEGAEEKIDAALNRYIDEIGFIGIEPEKFEDSVCDILKVYDRKYYGVTSPEIFDQIFYTLKDDVYFESSLKLTASLLKSLKLDQVSEVSSLLCDESHQFKFLMFPDVDLIFNIEGDILANYEDYKVLTPDFDEYGEKIAKSLRLNGKKQELDRKLAELKKNLSEIKLEKFNCEGVEIYKFKDETRFVTFVFDLKGLTDEELCYMPVLCKIIERKIPKQYDSNVFVDADVVQNKVKDEYFKLEVKCWFRDDSINLSFIEGLYMTIDGFDPMEISKLLATTLSSSQRNRFSENLSRELALRMDSNDLSYRGTVHRRTFYDALFTSGSRDTDKAIEAYCDFHDACYKVLRRSNLKIMTTSGVLDKGEADCDPKKLVEAIYDFEDVEQREKQMRDDKEVTFHYANLQSSATSVIKSKKLEEFKLGEKIVCDRVLYNFMYILFRQLGLSYQIDGTISGDYITLTSHAIRCCDDYRSAFNACGVYFENFQGNLNHYKLEACELLLEMFSGTMNPKIFMFRYLESGMDFDEMMNLPEIIESVSEEDLKKIGAILKAASYQAKVYAICGPGSSPVNLDDIGINRDYIFPEFLI